MNLYNEFSGPMAAWLRELVKCGHIAPGTVDETDINKLDYAKLKTFTQFHAFAGIGGWSAALRLAGWPDDRPVWTGSCPCQPFSIAGKRKAEADERHVWPAFRAAIAECRPPTVFGEQVASEDGRIWLAGVRSDLEALGYVVGAADLCAAGISAPHIRQRLYWVAYAVGAKRWTQTERGQHVVNRQDAGRQETNSRSGVRGSDVDGLEHPDGERCGQRHPPGVAATPEHHTGPDSAPQRLDQPNRDGRHPSQANETVPKSDGPEQRLPVGDGAGLVNADGYHRQWWSGPLQVGWNCIEGEIERSGRKYRAQWRTKPGLSLLAAGLSDFLVDLLRENALNAQTEVTHYAQTCDSTPHQILRVVQKAVRAKTLQWPTGVQREFRQEEVLLFFLLHLQTAFSGGSIGGGFAKPCSENDHKGVRSVRNNLRIVSPSCRPQPDEQFERQYSDALFELSQFLARSAAQECEIISLKDASAARRDKLSGRVAQLCGFGNAIVPILAAQFILASEEAFNETAQAQSTVLK